VFLAPSSSPWIGDPRVLSAGAARFEQDHRSKERRAFGAEWPSIFGSAPRCGLRSRRACFGRRLC
jgi:hypothetical protein